MINWFIIILGIILLIIGPKLENIWLGDYWYPIAVGIGTLLTILGHINATKKHIDVKIDEALNKNNAIPNLENWSDSEYAKNVIRSTSIPALAEKINRDLQAGKGMNLTEIDKTIKKLYKK